MAFTVQVYRIYVGRFYNEFKIIASEDRRPMN